MVKSREIPYFCTFENESKFLMRIQSLYLLLLAFAMVGCNRSNTVRTPDATPIQEQDPEFVQNETVDSSYFEVTDDPLAGLDTLLFDVYDDVDWSKPLYELDDEGDTMDIWTYNQRGLPIRDDFLLNNDYGTDYTSYYYDSDNRLVSSFSHLFTGNVREASCDYTYEGNVLTVEQIHTTEGYPTFFYVKEVSYFMDEDFKYDTMYVRYEREVSWDEFDDEGGNDEQLELQEFVTKKYEEVEGKTRLKEECYYLPVEGYADSLMLTSRLWHLYNPQGLRVRTACVWGDGWRIVDEYTYQGNMMDGTTCYLRQSDLDRIAEWEYYEPKEEIATEVAKMLVPEEYWEGIQSEQKTVATVEVEDGGSITTACYERMDGSWLVLEYMAIAGPDHDRLSLYDFRNGELLPCDRFNLPLQVEEGEVRENNFYFPYQGESLYFTERMMSFPVEDAEAVWLLWNGKTFELE